MEILDPKIIRKLFDLMEQSKTWQIINPSRLGLGGEIVMLDITPDDGIRRRITCSREKDIFAMHAFLRREHADCERGHCPKFVLSVPVEGEEKWDANWRRLADDMIEAMNRTAVLYDDEEFRSKSRAEPAGGSDAQ